MNDEQVMTARAVCACPACGNHRSIGEPTDSMQPLVPGLGAEGLLPEKISLDRIGKDPGVQMPGRSRRTRGLFERLRGEIDTLSQDELILVRELIDVHPRLLVQAGCPGRALRIDVKRDAFLAHGQERSKHPAQQRKRNPSSSPRATHPERVHVGFCRVRLEDGGGKARPGDLVSVPGDQAEFRIILRIVANLVFPSFEPLVEIALHVSVVIPERFVQRLDDTPERFVASQIERSKFYPYRQIGSLNSAGKRCSHAPKGSDPQ